MKGLLLLTVGVAAGFAIVALVESRLDVGVDCTRWRDGHRDWVERDELPR